MISQNSVFNNYPDDTDAPKDISGPSCAEIPNIPEDLFRYVENDFGDSISNQSKQLVELREMLVQSVSPAELETFDISDANLVRYLRCKKFQIEKAFEVIANNIAFKKLHPDWFNISTAEIHFFLTMVKVSTTVDDKMRRTVIFLPYKGIPFLTDSFLENYPQALTKFRLWLFDQISYDPYAQLGGIVLVMSFQRMTFWDCVKFSRLSTVYEHTESIRFATKCSGCRLKAVLIFEEPFFFGLIWSAVSLILSDKIKSRFKICGNKYDEIRRQFSDLNNFPVSLGGSGDDNFLVDNWIIPLYERYCSLSLEDKPK